MIVRCGHRQEGTYADSQGNAGKYGHGDDSSLRRIGGCRFQNVPCGAEEPDRGRQDPDPDKDVRWVVEAEYALLGGQTRIACMGHKVPSAIKRRVRLGRNGMAGF